jgi:spore coat protein U-like protein
LAAAAPLAAEAGNIGRIEIGGTVPANCELTIERSAAAFNPRTGVADLRIASITETCNAAGGYQVTIASTNSGVLRGVDTAESTGGYTLAYGETVARPNVPLVVNRPVEATGRSRDLRISLPAQPNLRAGTYADTLLLTVAGK